MLCVIDLHIPIHLVTEEKTESCHVVKRVIIMALTSTHDFKRLASNGQSTRRSGWHNSLVDS